MSNETCIEFDDVVAGYKDFMILNNLSFKAKKGTITLLLGPNGAGKSTVLKTLFGLLKPRQGSIKLDGVEIGGATQKQLLAQTPSPVPQTWHKVLPHDLPLGSMLVRWNSGRGKVDKSFVTRPESCT